MSDTKTTKEVDWTETTSALLSHMGETMEHVKAEEGADTVQARWSGDGSLYYDFLLGDILISTWACSSHERGLKFEKVVLQTH